MEAGNEYDPRIYEALREFVAFLGTAADADRLACGSLMSRYPFIE